MHEYAKYLKWENVGSLKFVRSPIQVILAQINFWRIGKIRHEVKRWVWRLTESLWQDLTSLQLPWPALLITSAMGLDQPDWYTFDGLVLRRKKVLISPSTHPLIDFHCLSCDVLRCTILVLTTSLEFSNSYKFVFASMYKRYEKMARNDWLMAKVWVVCGLKSCFIEENYLWGEEKKEKMRDAR